MLPPFVWPILWCSCLDEEYIACGCSFGYTLINRVYGIHLGLLGQDLVSRSQFRCYIRNIIRVMSKQHQHCGETYFLHVQLEHIDVYFWMLNFLSQIFFENTSVVATKRTWIYFSFAKSNPWLVLFRYTSGKVLKRYYTSSILKYFILNYSWV